MKTNIFFKSVFKLKLKTGSASVTMMEPVPVACPFYFPLHPDTSVPGHNQWYTKENTGDVPGISIRCGYILKCYIPT